VAGGGELDAKATWRSPFAWGGPGGLWRRAGGPGELETVAELPR
jgi:hypothetical protein